jgi:hypothetical protein
MHSLFSILLAGIPLVSLGWTGIPAAAQSANPSLCRQFPQDIRCNLSAPSQVGQAPQLTARPRVAVLDFVLRKLTEPAGQIQLTEVDTSSSVGRILSGSGFRVGDVAKPLR